jgi:hypothetical protein
MRLEEKAKIIEIGGPEDLEGKRKEYHHRHRPQSSKVVSSHLLPS